MAPPRDRKLPPPGSTPQVGQRVRHAQRRRTPDPESGRWLLFDEVATTSNASHDAPAASNPARGILEHWLAAANGPFSLLLDKLTPGQRPVLCEFLREPSDRHVARQLQLCESTVRNHLSVIQTRLNAASREHLIAMCLAAMVRETIADSPGT